MAIGEEPVVPNSMKPVRQQVEEEAAHELADLQSHDFVLVIAAFSVILPAEGHMGLLRSSKRLLEIATRCE